MLGVGCLLYTSGHDAGDISEHQVTIHAKYFTEILPGAIPTGKLVPVEGTPMDFNTPKKIGEEIDKEWDQLEMVGGYDHNWCLDNYDGKVRLVASVTNPSGSRTMKVFTDLPGVQFYTSNGMAEQTGKGGANYGSRTAYCLETQFYPCLLYTSTKPGADEKIRKFVSEGGTFVTTFLSGLVDEHDLVITGGYPGKLRDILGIWVEETDALPSYMKNSFSWNGKDYDCGLILSLIHI